MYIKQVTIKGFKTYRDQTLVEPFSEHHNTIVGRNGSGKSNFFHAISFVLSGKYANLSADARQQLLHKGPGHKVMTAFVEILIDNSDGRIPNEQTEVRLRRSIGVKGDDYYLNGKRVNKGEIVNLLENAGFSRSNPYYIVQQGQIDTLATMSEEKRLELLEDVAGTRVYDERKRESLQILEDTEHQQERIDGVLQDIQARLDELEGEKQEFAQYQELDKDRRALQYNIYLQESANVKAKIVEVEAARKELAARKHSADEDGFSVEADIDRIAAELAHIKASYEALAAEKQQLEETREAQVKEVAKLEVDLTDFKSRTESSATRRTEIEDRLADIQTQIEEKQRRLDELEPSYNDVQARITEIQSRLERSQHRRDAILAKESHTQQYSSPEERDAFLKAQIKNCQSIVSKKQATIAEYKQQITSEFKRKDTLAEQLEGVTEELQSHKQRMTTLNQEIMELRKQHNELQNMKQATESERAHCERNFSVAKDAAQQAEAKLLETVPPAVAKGIQSVQAVVQKHNIRGVYGPLINLIEVPEAYLVAADTVGKALFNVVTESHHAAREVLHFIDREKLPGRVTFLPLDKLRSQRREYPRGSEFVPLVNVINSEPKFEPAVRHVFGRTIVCKDMAAAESSSRTADLDAVTLDGDKFSRNGIVSGGFVDKRASKLAMQRTLTANKGEVDKYGEQLQKHNAVVADLEQKVLKVLNATQQATNDHSLQEQGHAHLLNEKDRLSRALDTVATTTIPALEKEIGALEADVTRVTTQIQDYQTEVGQDLESQLNDDEQEELAAMHKQIETLQEQNRRLLAEKSEIHRERVHLEESIKTHLSKRKRELESELERITDVEVDVTEVDLQALRATISTSDKRLKRIEKELEQARTQQASKTAELDERKAQQSMQDSTAEDVERDLELLLNQRSNLMQKQEDYHTKIVDLGALPSNVKQYEKHSLKRLNAQLAKTRKKLKSYQHVNKKALEQYRNFSEQRDTLESRRRTQDDGTEAIHALIRKLDIQKFDAIELTFKQVAKYFAETFQRLVPGGRGRLIINKAAPTDTEGSQDASAAAMAEPMLRYQGVAIKVSFTGQEEDYHLIQQFSGGQRSVVALALIFAIQKCDPAPFYLFDEIDAALDPTFRQAVASMIHESAQHAQYITTTFMRELVLSCDKCYGVNFANQVSVVRVVPREDALQFVEEDVSR
eukprot:m.101151 g.101151  ORF g.101151 m.101151 type:complete len:1193 (+) comp13195_c1_seq1:372-3950(+)